MLQLDAIRKRYWVFKSEAFAPNQGMKDFHSAHNELLPAKRAAERAPEGQQEFWSCVFDSHTGHQFNYENGERSLTDATWKLDLG